VQGDVLRAIDSLRMTQKHIVGELQAIVGPKGLLKSDTREAMLGWLGAVLEGNGERAKMRSNLRVAASHGFFLNLNAVLLKLCGPFMDPSSNTFWQRVDVRYVTQGQRLSFAEVGRRWLKGGLEACWG
jgi:ubiquitin conjugation factor E4 B